MEGLDTAYCLQGLTKLESHALSEEFELVHGKTYLG